MTIPTEPPQKVAPPLMREPKEVVPGEEANSPLGLLILAGLMAALWLFAGPRYLVMALGLLLMIFLHELGHFMTARWTGMKATQFFLGFGPRIWSFRRGETEYGIRAIPAGAFVRIIGMSNLDPVEDPADEPRAYYNATYPRRMLVITAGSMMHFLQAIVIFVLLVTVVGRPDPDLENGWSVGEIVALETGETPAQMAGIEIGDRILSIDDVDATEFHAMRDYIAERPGEEVTLVVLRDGKQFETTTTVAVNPWSDGTTTGFIGVVAQSDLVKGSVGDGLVVFGETMRATVVEGLPRLVDPGTFIDLFNQLGESPGAVDVTSEDAQRPVSVVGVVRVAGNPSFDWSFPLFMLGLVNVFVGVFNLVPLLPLDGGHAAVATYERLRSFFTPNYRADVTKLIPLTYAVMGLLGFMFISTLWLDIARPIQ